MWSQSSEMAADVIEMQLQSLLNLFLLHLSPLYQTNPFLANCHFYFPLRFKLYSFLYPVSHLIPLIAQNLLLPYWHWPHEHVLRPSDVGLVETCMVIRLLGDNPRPGRTIHVITIYKNCVQTVCSG